MDVQEIQAKIVATERRLEGSVYPQMDKDAALWGMKETKYETHETGINVTSNSPRTFANDVQTDLASAERQFVVRMAEAEGEDKRDDIAKLERLFEFLFEKADEHLIAKQIAPLREFSIWCSLIRASMAVRILIYKDGDKVVPDFLPLDPRWLPHEVGGNGLAWAAPKLFKSKIQLQDEYGHTPTATPWYTPWVKEKELYVVYDHWEFIKPGEVVNKIIQGNSLLYEHTYKLDSMPIIIMPVSMHPQFYHPESESFLGQGGGLYAANRGVYALQNKLASMWATHSNILQKQPLLNYYDEQGKPLEDTILYAEGVYNLPMNHQKIEPSPMKEISPTLINLMAWVEGQVEHGSLPHIGIGSDPPSGTALSLVKDAGNRVYNPQARTLSRFYATMCRLIEEQLLSEKIKVKVESEKDWKYYGAEVKPVDLKKPHVIKVEFTVKTPWTQMDVMQLADFAKKLGLPDQFIYEHIMKLPDPKGIGDQAAIEMAEHSPKLAMARAIDALLKFGRAEEAEQLMRDMYQMEMQEQMGGQGGGQEQTQGAGI